MTQNKPHSRILPLRSLAIPRTIFWLALELSVALSIAHSVLSTQRLLRVSPIIHFRAASYFLRRSGSLRSLSINDRFCAVSHLYRFTKPEPKRASFSCKNACR